MTQHYGPGDPANIRPGDRITVTFTAGDEGVDLRRYREGSLVLDCKTPYILRVDRPIDLPTKPGAVIFPYVPHNDFAYFLNEEASGWRDGEGDPTNESLVLQRLTEGTHYIAFEGVDVAMSTDDI